MRELSSEESKSLLLDIIKSIDNCCRKNDIHYSLNFGTLLGAVRHNGFIPWDDDMDIMMTRDDLNQFVKCFNSDRYEIITNDKPDWGWSYVSICDTKTIVKYNHDYERVTPHGLWVSIFPVDKCAPDDDNWSKQKKAIKKWANYCRIKKSKWVPTGFCRNVVKSILRFVLSPCSLIYLAKKEDYHRSKYNNTNSNKSFVQVYLFPFHVFSSDWMHTYCDLIFEGQKLMAIKEYDGLLRLFYGDYMILPPKEQQKQGHDYVAYFI